MRISVLGVDLGKNVCSVVGLDTSGAVVLRRRAKRETLIALAAKISPCIVGMEPAAAPSDADENLRLADLSRRRIGDADPLARILYERLFAGDMVLAHHRSDPPFEIHEADRRTGCSHSPRDGPLGIPPRESSS